MEHVAQVDCRARERLGHGKRGNIVRGGDVVDDAHDFRHLEAILHPADGGYDFRRVENTRHRTEEMWRLTTSD